MNANQKIATREPGGVEQATGESTTAPEAARGRERFMIPPVDILEDAYQLIVQADIPGVSKETLNVKVDRNSLLIEGDVAIGMPTGMTALYADLQTTKYHRSFALSGELDTERISANLEDGLLTVRIPKRPEFRTRKIKVEVP
jgi:HSP20 family molecular chaperone IbpA